MLAGFADGFLLAAPSLAMDHIDSTIALVAGTGSVNLGERSYSLFSFLHAVYTKRSSSVFRKVEGEIQLTGMSGGWGYL